MLPFLVSCFFLPAAVGYELWSGALPMGLLGWPSLDPVSRSSTRFLPMARSVWMWFKVSMALEWLLSECARWRHPDQFLFRRFHHSAGHPSPCYLPDMKLNEVIFPFNNFLIKIIFNFLIIFSSVAGRMQIFVLLQVVNTQRRSYPHSPRHDRSHLLVKKPRKLHHQNRKYYQNASLWDAEKLLVLSPPSFGVEAEPDGVALG